MLIQCPECNHNCSDKAASCPSCGYPFINVPSNVTASSMRPSRAKMRRLPNGFGSIKRLSGKRRHPYAAYPPTTAYHDNGTAVYRQAIGYFATYNDAYKALTVYNETPYDEKWKSAPFSDIYELFMREKFNDSSTLSESSLRSYQAAYKNARKLHDKTYSLLKKEDFQAIVDECELGYGSKHRIINLFKQMDKYALAHDIIQKGYSQFCQIKTPNDYEKGVPFTMDEIKTIIKNHDETALILLYTGMRISELNTVKRIDKRFIRGGLKTKAGKDRLIPLHPAIQDIEIKPINVAAYRNAFKQTYKGHTPHDLRHTTTWLMQTYNCDDLSTRLILGHSLTNDIEKNTYGHRTNEQLYEEICKIPTFKD